MFTGIIETTGEIVDLRKEGTNVHFTIASTISNELKIDQSVSHNGVCLTVIAVSESTHTVTAIEETLNKSNFRSMRIGDLVNLERCMVIGGRLDGHIVQGHVDQTAKCLEKNEHNGSWVFRFQYDQTIGNVTVEKGSICVNGISLTVVDSIKDGFSVHIIPYTYAYTNMVAINIGDEVNLEFDILGKYIARLLARTTS